MSEQKIDVFLAHNSLDKPLVRIIAEELKQLGITSWLDEEKILPGQYFQDSIQQAINHVNSAAICIGRAGLGRWQQAELRAFISRCVEQGVPVIPVLLPGVYEIPSANIFLKEVNWVSFTDGIDSEKSISLLAQGIKQRKSSSDRLSIFPSLISSTDDLSFQPKDWHNEKLLLQTSQKKKEFIAQQLSEHINDFEKYLETLQSQKESVEKKLEEIRSRVAFIESMLLKEKDKHLLNILQWLKDNQKRLAKSAGDYVTKSESSKKEISGDGGFKKLCWVLEKIVEVIDYCLLTNDDDILGLVERLSISPLHIEYVCEAVQHIHVRIGRQSFSSDTKERVDTAIEEISKCLGILRENMS